LPKRKLCFPAHNKSLRSRVSRPPFPASSSPACATTAKASKRVRPVVQIANDGTPIFTAQFSPADAAQIHVRDLASVQAQSIPGETSAGRVVAINPAQGDGRSVPVLIRLAKPLPAFGPRAYGQASVQVGVQRGLIVPTAAIVSDAATGNVQIFRREGESYTPIPVTVLATVGQRAIVVAPGLRPGMVVAAQGAAELVVPQQPVKADND
jgi:hypothetical protein